MLKHQLLATFMIFLVLTIPVFSGAQSITLDKYAGKDGVNGVVRERDTLSVGIIAKRSDGGAVSNDDVWLASKIGNEYVAENAFTSCKQLPDGNNECVYSEDDALPDDYQVQLRENNQVADTKDFTLITDDTEPSAELSYSLDEGKLQVDYDVDDGEKCSGIKSVDFYIKKGTQRSASFKTIPGKKEKCHLRDSFEITYSAGQQFVQGQLCAKVTDYFGKTSESCADTDFVYDKKSPTIKSAKLVSEDGFDLTHIKNSGDVNAQLVVEVEGDEISTGIDVTKDTITADLSAMNLDEKERKADRVDSQQSNKFIWDFTIKNTEDCKYTIKAADKQGNKAADATKSCTLSLDTTPPTVNSISTTPEVLGKKGGNITVMFGDSDDEGNEGVGISSGNVQISADDVRLASETPEECTKINGEWKCYWKVSVPASTESGDKKITVYAKDNIGNSMTAYEDKIKVDLEAPEGLSAEYLIIGGEDQSIPYPVLGDTIKFVLKGSKDVTSAEADFTPLKGSKQTFLCDKECAVTYTLKTGTTFGTKTINFIAYDQAGNKETISKQVTIYDTVKGKPKKDGYWDDVKGVKCMPSKIDRLTVAQFGDYPVYCQVELLARDSSAEVASVTVKQKDCTGDFVKNNVKNVEVIPNNENPYLVFTLEKKEFKETTASINCPITIHTIKNNRLDKNPEKETVESVLQFHLDSLGDIYSTNEKEIKDAIKKTEWDNDLIGKLKEILGWFEKICQLKSVIVLVVTVWQFIQMVFGAVETGGHPIAKALGYAGRTAGCVKKEMVQDEATSVLIPQLDKFCAALSCRSSQSGGWGILGGGGNLAPWCKSMDSWFNSPELRTMLNNVKKTQTEDIQFLNVKESILWSTICLCPAGIVHNLDKVKQIDCRYATCLIEDVKEKGISPDECKQLRSEMKCAYWFGEVWNAVPFTQVIDKLGNLIAQMITDPIKLVSMALASYCKTQCALPSPYPPKICTAASLLSLMGEVANTVNDAKLLKESWSKPVQNDYCAKLDTLKDAYKEEKEAEEGSGEE